MTKRTLAEMGPAELHARIVNAFVLLIGFLVGAGFLVRDAYLWLRLGQWQGVSAIDALQWLGLIDAAWGSSEALPQDWIGLHRLLTVLPLGLAIPLLATLIAGVIFFFGRLRGDTQLATQRAVDKAWRDYRNYRESA